MECCITCASSETFFFTDKAVQVNNVALYALVPELKDLSKASFYSYKGSLTTPPCYQSVNWIVLTKPIVASAYSVRNLIEC